MALSKKLLAGGLAALALLATAGSAFAAPAYATGNVNVRSGPSTGYGVLDVMRRGEQVDVQQCSGSWCFVQRYGPDGWVSSSYLSRSGGYQPPPPVVVQPSPPPYYDPYPPRPPHWNPAPPPRPPHWNPPPRPTYPSYPSYPGNGGSSGSVCFNGPNGYFCVGN